MKLSTIGATIATRELELAGGRRVTITLGKPERFPEDDGFYCPFKILGIGDGEVRYAAGEDSFQALDLTLKKIGATLYTSAEAKAGQLTWECGSVAGDLGFPVPDSVRPLVPKT